MSKTDGCLYMILNDVWATGSKWDSPKAPIQSDLENFLIAFKVRLYGKIQFLITERPLKMMKNALYFYLKSLFRSQDIYVFAMTFWSRRKNSSIRKLRLISKSAWRHNLVNKQLQYTYCPRSQEVKATRQWNLVN